MTYGQKAVGLTFNPSGDLKVQKLKELYAEIIDTLMDGRRDESIAELTQLRGQIFSTAVAEAMAAQMWAVKAVTWRD